MKNLLLILSIAVIMLTSCCKEDPQTIIYKNVIGTYTGTYDLQEWIDGSYEFRERNDVTVQITGTNNDNLIISFEDYSFPLEIVNTSENGAYLRYYTLDDVYPSYTIQCEFKYNWTSPTLTMRKRVNESELFQYEFHVYNR